MYMLAFKKKTLFSIVVIGFSSETIVLKEPIYLRIDSIIDDLDFESL